MRKKIKCINCNSAKLEKVFESRDFTTKRKYNYYKCAKCKVIFINPLPTVKRLARLYELKDGALEADANGILEVLWHNTFTYNFFVLFGKMVSNDRLKVVENLNIKGRKSLLDVGCGTGLFLRELCDKGWKVCGQEISKVTIKAAKKNLLNCDDVKITNKEITSYKIPQNIKVITMWHVFEHLTNFTKAIDHISKSMKQGSYLVLETPNSQALSLNLFKEKSPMALVPEHITFWSEEGFKHLLENDNFEIVSVSYPMTFPFTTTSGFYKLFSSRISSKYLAIFLASLTTPFSLLVYLFGRKMNESIRVIAKKK